VALARSALQRRRSDAVRLGAAAETAAPVALDVDAASDLRAEHGIPSPPRVPAWAGPEWDVVVAGAGNAAVVAALAADDSGARVLLLERAPKYMRGGNTRHTRNIRCVHGANTFTTGTYGHDELWRDLCNVGEGPGDEELARFTVHESESALGWMQAHGIRWQQPLAGTLHLGRTNQFFLGGGKALLNSYFREIDRRPRITVAYDAMLEELVFDQDVCQAVLVRHQGALHRVKLRSLVCACGGFEANVEWLRRYWGDAALNYIIRGTKYNDGHVLARLYEAGAAFAGQQKGLHAIAVDARADRFDGGIATRLDTIPFGIVVNRDATRFYDEGEEIWPKRYATWGSLIAAQPGQIAYSLWDAKVNGLFLPPMYGVNSAGDIESLARVLGLDPARARTTVERYNAGTVPGPRFDPAVLDECRTAGIFPPKSHWAQRLDTPPYYGIAMRPGITFTYMGVKVRQDARVVCTNGSVLSNVYAAGEIMSGNILSTGYLAGFGMTIGTVWGRQAGTEAARNVH
jgi:tricarballylate dehydrogenase